MPNDNEATPENGNPFGGNAVPLPVRLPPERPQSTKPEAFLNTLEPLFDEKWLDAGFRRLLETVTNAHSVNGSYETDRTVAALQVQTIATERRIPLVARAKLTKIKRGFETLLRRDKLGRRQRIALLSAPQAAE